MRKKTAPARLVSCSELGRLRRIWRRQRKRVIFTNGVFDILHMGHIELLDRAKSFGDILVIGLNSDASVRRLKGPSRPINSQRERAAILMALRSVDCVCIFSEDTPFELIGLLRPDVLVKGAEYSVETTCAAGPFTSWGGR